MNAKTALENMREKKILYVIKTPQGRWVSVYKPAMLRAHIDDRENVIVLDSKLLLGSPDEQPCYPGIADCTDKGTHIYTFLEKLDKILIYPRYKTVEERSDPDGDRLIIERFDGIRFRIEPGALLNVVANVEVNPGITLGDLHGILAIIYARDVPGFFSDTEEEALRKSFDIAVGVAFDIGFLYYEAELVELKFL